MLIQDLQKRYARHPRVKTLARLLENDKAQVVQLAGLQASATPLVFASLALAAPQVLGCPYVFILDDAEAAGYFYHDLIQLLGDREVLFFPSSYRRAVRFGQRDAANEILRTEVLSRLSSGTLPLYVVTYPEALAELVVTRQQLFDQTLHLRVDERVDIMFVQETLLSFGFSRVDYVYEPGQFAVRGSLIDVYSFSCEHPYRIDFFGDTVDSIRTFEVETQLSLSRQQQISLVPELSRCSESRDCFLRFLPEDSVLVARDLTYVCDRVQQTYDEGFSMQALIVGEDMGGGEEALLREKLLANPQDFCRDASGFRRILLTNQPAADKQTYTLHFNITPQPVFHKDFPLVIRTLREYQECSYDLFILADSEKQTNRLECIFHDQETGIRFTPVNKTLHEGFCDDDLHLCCFTDHQIFDRFHKYSLKSDRARSGKVALTLKELQQFELGDYVVHVDHGVGRFGGLVNVPIGNHTQEAIKIIYSNNAFILVSLHALHKVSKYKGREGEAPRVSALGTGAWERMKERTKTHIKDIARDLIRLYSRRRDEKGFAFSPDGYMQHELEASFLYEDTPDQLKATQEVKADMEKSRPMDRLVCGDVGFGKTEVAIRAAFKACADGKQVAVLVPTTVLAYQHFRSFSSRLRDMPVTVEYLSRARNAQKTKQILQDLKEGRINILIGTHKLTGKSVQFQDLGLLIIDEEQKFGVSVKEKIRQMKTNVDTLTLTATPIPRTLQFSLMGARDMSVIQTPPPNRYPIQTQLCGFSGEVIAEAINFEMSRGGQVFLVNNRISNLPELEELVHKYVPDARVAVGHGQMSPEVLEKRLIDFVNYDYDVLISTTIIESGIDIPNVNTIIVCGAQNFGLSDLHQMRGRVGRGNRKAFCYLLTPPASLLNPDARRRLQAIASFSGLGSGIHLAMQDLDIRGAGNLLGAEQSGFIADLGYETYQKILSQAVKELRNDEFHELYTDEASASEVADGTDFVDECLFESDLPMYFGEEYVPTSAERMLLYRELDGLDREEDIRQFRLRLTDRFGPVPPEGEDLIRVVSLRRLGKYFGTEKIILKGGRMRMCFVSNPRSPFFQSPAFGQIITFSIANAHRCRLDETNARRSFVVQDVPGVGEALALLEQIRGQRT